MATDNNGQTVTLTNTDKDILLTEIKQKIDEGYIPLGGFETNITPSKHQSVKGFENEITPPYGNYTGKHKIYSINV